MRLQRRCRACQACGVHREPDIKRQPTSIDALFAERHSTRKGWMAVSILTRIVRGPHATGGMARTYARSIRARNPYCSSDSAALRLDDYSIVGTEDTASRNYSLLVTRISPLGNASTTRRSVSEKWRRPLASALKSSALARSESTVSSLAHTSIP